MVVHLYVIFFSLSNGKMTLCAPKSRSGTLAKFCARVWPVTLKTFKNHPKCHQFSVFHQFSVLILFLIHLSCTPSYTHQIAIQASTNTSSQQECHQCDARPVWTWMKSLKPRALLNCTDHIYPIISYLILMNKCQFIYSILLQKRKNKNKHTHRNQISIHMSCMHWLSVSPCTFTWWSCALAPLPIL